MSKLSIFQREKKSNYFNKISMSFLDIQKLPKNSSPIRIRNRCCLTGRPRGVFRRFGLSRIVIRNLSFKGYAPGLLKSS